MYNCTLSANQTKQEERFFYNFFFKRKKKKMKGSLNEH